MADFNLKDALTDVAPFSNKTSSQQIELANKLMKEYFSTTK